MNGRRTVSDALRRGADNALANWQLLLIRIAEAVAMAIVTIGAVAVLLAPFFVALAGGTFLRDLASAVRSAKRGESDTAEMSALFETIVQIFAGRWWILLYALVVITILLTILVVVHSFVIAGVARVLVDGERGAGDAAARSAFARFSMERWFAGAKQNFWAVFWIYNIVYGVVALIVLVPLVIVLVLMLLLQASAAALVVGCLGLVASLALMIVLSVVATVMCQKAIVLAAWRNTDAVSAVEEARRAVGRDFARHAGLALVLLLISFGASGLFTMGGFFFALPGSASPMIGFVLLPVRMLLSLLSSIVSAAIGMWMISAFAAITER